MPRRITEDHKAFRDVYSGRTRKELKRFIKNGQIFRGRGKDGKIPMTIPRIDIPHIVHGSKGNGVGRGPGKPGDSLGNDGSGKGKGKGKGKPGDGAADGVTINVDLEDILKFMQDELGLPDMKQKPNATFDETRIRYNNISLNGPESLRHNRRTMQQAMKRLAAAGSLGEKHIIPGMQTPVPLITPINSDKRYRQYTEVKIPSSNAVIFFARDGSGSMTQEKCDIVSDMSWWIDVWIRRFYKKVERMYVWHDTEAKEVSEEKFYNYRYGGGTRCSSALNLIEKEMQHRFTPEKWNVYIFYFGDGENWGHDNELFAQICKEKFGPETVNMIGITQVLSWMTTDSLKDYMDNNLVPQASNVRTAEIGAGGGGGGWGGWGQSNISPEDRDMQIMEAIKSMLGSGQEAVASS